MKGPAGGAGERAPRRLGVMGTLVLDEIVRPGRPAATGLWGGIAYSVAAFDHVLGAGWRLVPLIVVGADVAEAGERCLARLSPSADLSRLRTADARNNRVELRPAPGGRRTERLTGGVPGWTADEIAGELAGLDALYVNFVSGAEMTLAGSRRIRDDFGGPAYADLHSLFLGTESGGVRMPRVFAQAPDVAACFDYVQMNQEEFALFRRSAGGDEPALSGRAKLLAVTLGPQGADLFERPRGAADPGGAGAGRASAPATGSDAGGRPGRRGRAGAGRTQAPGAKAVARRVQAGADAGAAEGLLPVARVVARRVAAERGPPDADPIGCGDVWGAALFAGLLEGRTPPRAASQAHAVAARNLACSGALALKARLDGGTGDGPPGASSPSPFRP